jgi:hypothetical protein
MLVAVALCVKGIPLAPVPDTCTARSTCARGSCRRSAIIASDEAALAILGGPFTSRPVVLHQPSGSIVTVFVFRLASWRVGSPDCRSASYARLRPGTTFGPARLFPRRKFGHGGFLCRALPFINCTRDRRPRGAAEGCVTDCLSLSLL